MTKRSRAPKRPESGKPVARKISILRNGVPIVVVTGDGTAAPKLTVDVGVNPVDVVTALTWGTLLMARLLGKDDIVLRVDDAVPPITN